jgi:predicted MPP superfamily phosphohydrolase
MISRREINRDITNEIEKDKRINFSKKLSKVLVIIIFIITLFFLYMRFVGTSFIVTREKYLYDNIPNSFHGLKIVQISDLLYGGTIRDSELTKISKEIKKIKPDIIVFTGDLVHTSYNLIKSENLIKFFKELEAPYGKYAVYGELDKDDFVKVMNEAGFTILNNDTKELFNKEVDGITVKGLNINNPTSVNNTDGYNICLIHNYDYFDKFNTNCDITLAGHTLYGEIKLPKIAGIFNESKYSDSYYKEGDNDIYISNGLGSKHYLRLFNHPSLNVYRIYKK